MSNAAPVVIVGAGHGGVQVAVSLREEGYDGPIVLIGDEPHVPYHRPPLSKAFLKREVPAEALQLRPPTYYGEKGIDFRPGVRVEAIDRALKQVRLSSGETLGYAHLVLATGARQRPLNVPGVELAGVLSLRGLDDAELLRERAEKARHAVVIGAGFIGLEFAAVAAGFGCAVTVLELADRPMARALTSLMSAHFAKVHASKGIRLLFGTGITAIEGRDGAVSAVVTSTGERLPADLVLVGIGVIPNQQLAQAAGLTCSNGIEVDALMRTSDPDISAIGDVAFHPNAFSARMMRLESVQNALDQARTVARRLVGRAAPYTALPWFWSDQGEMKLQIAGLVDGADSLVTRGDPASGAFSVFAFRTGQLLGVESVNKPGDHMAARKILSGGLTITPTEAADLTIEMKALATRKA